MALNCFVKKLSTVLMLSVCVLVGCSVDHDEEIVTIGDYPVTMEDYCSVMDKQKSDVYNYFTAVYQIQPGDLEWDQPYGEDIPADMLIQETTEKLQQDMFILRMAEERQMTSDGSLGSVRTLWEKDQQTDAVYGPKEKEYYEYYDYYMADMESRVKDALWEEEDVSRAAIQEHYEQTQNKNYRKPKQWEARRCYISKSAGKEGKELLETYRQKLASEKESEQLFKEMGQTDITVEKINSKPESEHYNMSVFPELAQTIDHSVRGEITHIIDEGDVWEFAVVTSASDSGYYTLGEVEETVIYEMKEEVFAGKLEDWKKMNPVKQNETMKKNILVYLEEE